MRHGRRLVTLAASLSLHGAAVLAVLLSISGETEVGPLFIDLTERARAGRGEAPAGAPAAAPTPRAQGVLRVARSSPPVTSPAPSAPQRAEMGERAPLAAAIAEPVAPPPATASSAPPEAAPPDPMPTIAGETDASAPGAASAAPSSSAAAAPEGPATLSEVFAGLSVGGGTPGDAPEASHGFALAVPGAAGAQSGPGAEYGAYLGRLRQRVQQALGYPLAARRRGLSGTVHVEIVIRPDGVIGGVAVADSSSHAILDDAAVDTIRRLAPAPFPSDVQPRTLRVRLPVVFALE